MMKWKIQNFRKEDDHLPLWARWEEFKLRRQIRKQMKQDGKIFGTGKTKPKPKIEDHRNQKKRKGRIIIH